MVLGKVTVAYSENHKALTKHCVGKTQFATLQLVLHIATAVF